MTGVAVLTPASAQTGGILLLSIVFIAYGGTFMLELGGGTADATDFQRAWFRAGHAHAGVLVILSLVVLLYLDAAALCTWTPQRWRVSSPAPPARWCHPIGALSPPPPARR